MNKDSNAQGNVEQRERMVCGKLCITKTKIHN